MPPYTVFYISLCKVVLEVRLHIFVGQARNPVFNSQTPLFEYGKFSIKKIWVTLCISSQTHILANTTVFDAKTLRIALLT